MYEKGEVKALVFEWNVEQRKWLNNEPRVTLRYGNRVFLEKLLRDVQFVSAAACSGKNVDKLVLFYVESNEWPEPPPSLA